MRRVMRVPRALTTVFGESGVYPGHEQEYSWLVTGNEKKVP